MSLVYVENISEQKIIIEGLIKSINNDLDYVYLDTETTGLDPFSSKVLLVQLMIGDILYVFNVHKVGVKFFVNLIKHINKYNFRVVGHNIKFDLKMLKSLTGLWINNVYDTLIAETVITAGVGDALYSLSDLVLKYCSQTIDKSIRKSFIDDGQPVDFFTEDQINYAAGDLIYLPDILKGQLDVINKENLLKVNNLEMDIVPMVCSMEYSGTLLDVDYWKDLTKQKDNTANSLLEEFKDMLFDRLDVSRFSNALEFANAIKIPVKTKRDKLALESIIDSKDIYSWAKSNFNINSNPQMLTALNMCGIKAKSTNEKVLNKVSKDDLIDKLLEYREYKKLVSTYGYNIIDLINPNTGRIHTEYFQNGTKTGRFSSRNPNMQNLPRVGGYREGFVPPKDYSFISMDYSQQEYRLIGSVSKDPKIINAYTSGSDMHTSTAAERFGKTLDAVTPEERNFGKTMNFAILYGTTEWGLKKNFSIKLEEAVEMLNQFYKGYEVLSAFKNRVEDLILKLGYSVTPYGRKRYFKPLGVFATKAEIEMYESQVKREGFNMIIQGGGADITKLALLDMWKRNPFGDLFQPVLQVHDEIVVQAHDSIIKEAEDFMRQCMIDSFQPFLGEIPAKVDSRISKRWGKG